MQTPKEAIKITEVARSAKEVVVRKAEEVDVVAVDEVIRTRTWSTGPKT